MTATPTVETFPAPPVLDIRKPRDEQRSIEAQQAPSAAQSLQDAKEREGEADAEVSDAPQRAVLTLQLSRAETVEDAEDADIVVDSAEQHDEPEQRPAVRLRLSLTGVDAEEGASAIAISADSAQQPDGVEDAGVALENRWQLRVKETDAALKRASFEVTTEGILRTRSFAIGKSGFQRTSDADRDTAGAATPDNGSGTGWTGGQGAGVERPHLDVSDATLVEMGLLGRGAGGKVVKCLHTASLTVVAVKCIDVSDKAKRAQLLKELKELATDYCANIVAFYGAYYVDSTCTVKLGLEYMNRGSLQAIVHEHGRLHELALSHVVRQTLLGLLHLHSARKLHRDIKPGNILVNHRGVCKLSDFGILAELSSSMAKCGTFVGTTIYMSPERLTSEAYSYPADVWSLGLTVITLATGSFPLSTDDGYWGLVMHFNTKPPPTLPDSFSPTFRDFVSRCLLKEPAKRWGVRELLDHPWIVNGCEAEEALTYWPEGARMHEPDPAVVKRQREDRLDRTRRWEEAEERKRRRQDAAAAARAKAPAAVVGEEAGTERAEVGHAEDDSAKVRHRRRAAITRFHPVGLLHLQAEASVQNASKRVAAGHIEHKPDALYGDGSDDERDDDAAASTASTEAARGIAGAADGTRGSPEPSAAVKADMRTLRAAKASAESPAPAARPRKLSQTRSAMGPGSDYNLVSPARAHRHNVKFVNGQIVSSFPALPSSAAAADAPQPAQPSQSSFPLLPALAPTASLQPAPPSPSPAAARRKALGAIAADSSPARERAQSGTTSAAPSPQTSTSAAATLPGVPHRGSPVLHRRSPSVPAALLSGGCPISPLALQPGSPVPSVGSPSSPLAVAVEGQRRLRERRPSITANRPANKLPALHTAGEGKELQTERPSPSLPASEPAAVLPAQLVLPASAISPSSPVSQQPLSTRSSKALSLIQASELDDLRTVLTAVVEVYRSKQQQQQAPRTGSISFSIDSAPTPSSGDDPASSPSSSSSASSLASGSLSSTLDSAPLLSWLPDETSLQATLLRIADQLGIRPSICLHHYRKLVAPLIAAAAQRDATAQSGIAV